MSLMAIGTQAQVVPDDTLGGERSQVRPETIRGVESDRIEGGARRGGNLFHSFERLNIGAGRGAYFNNPDGVENIFGRVTGNLPSDIQGTLGVIREGRTDTVGTANLFLMNPNGIVFGQGARLDLGGSFVGTTADAIGFGDFGVFGSRVAEPPAALLNVNPSALLFNAPLIDSASIVVQGDGRGVRTTTELIDTQAGLRVENGNTLALISNDITLEGATLKTAGGRIEIGSVLSSSTVGVSPVADGWSFNYAGTRDFGNIQLLQNSVVDASGSGGGTIRVQGRRIGLSGGSQLESSTLAEQIGGKLEIVASESVDIDNSQPNDSQTGIYVDVYPGASGEGSDLSIFTGKLALRNGGLMSVNNNGLGNGGDLSVVTRDLELENGGLITANNNGLGNAGSINIVARGIIRLDTLNLRSRILNSVNADAEGNTGGIRINTNSLFLSGGSQISALVTGRGSTGGIAIRAREIVSLDGRDNIPQRVFPSGIFVNLEGSGSGGDISISARSFRLTNRAQVAAVLKGKGSVGDIVIHTVDRVFLLNSLINTEVTEQRGIGQGGDIMIRAGSLELRDGSALLADTENIGDAGNIIIDVQGAVILAGRGSSAFNLNVPVSSQISSTVDRVNNPDITITGNSVGIGKGGRVRITSRSLTMGDGGFIETSSFGQGDAGNINVHADRINLTDTSSISSAVERQGIGDGGNIRIQAQRLTLDNEAFISASSSGRGIAGNIWIGEAESIRLSGRSSISATNRSEGRGAGDVILSSDRLILSTSSQLRTSTNNDRRAGNILLTDSGNITVNGRNSGIFANTSATSGGRGGRVEITTDNLTLENRGAIAAQSRGTGEAGNIEINGDRLTTTNGNITTSARSASGGAITINAGQIRLNGDSDIQTNVQQGQAGAGDITLNANTPILAFDDSDILASADSDRGRGGQITFNSPGLFAENYEPAPRGTEQQLERNNRVDINANAQQPGTVVTPDTSFISNSLTDISEVPIDTDRLLANTCLARAQQPGQFTITGTDGLPQSPSNATQSAYPTGAIQPIPETESRRDRPWQMGDAIVEPQSIYRLPDGSLAMKTGCSE